MNIHAYLLHLVQGQKCRAQNNVLVVVYVGLKCPSQVIFRPTSVYDQAVQFGRTNLLYISNGEANDCL